LEPDQKSVAPAPQHPRDNHRERHAEQRVRGWLSALTVCVRAGRGLKMSSYSMVWVVIGGSSVSAAVGAAVVWPLGTVALRRCTPAPWRATLLSAQVTARRLLAVEGQPLLHWSARRMPSTHLILAGWPAAAFFRSCRHFSSRDSAGHAPHPPRVLVSSTPFVLQPGIDCCGGCVS